MARSDEDEGASGSQGKLLPEANVLRIIRRQLPADAHVSQEAREFMTECVSEFVSLITGIAAEKCREEDRKAITGHDLLCAMSRMGFQDYIGPLDTYLHNYRLSEGRKKGKTSRPEGSSNYEYRPPGSPEYSGTSEYGGPSEHSGTSQYDGPAEFSGTSQYGEPSGPSQYSEISQYSEPYGGHSQYS